MIVGIVQKMVGGAGSSPGGFSRHIDCTSLMFGVSSRRDTMGTICNTRGSVQSAFIKKFRIYNLVHLFVFGFLREELILHCHAK